MAKGGSTTAQPNPLSALYLNQLWKALPDVDRRQALLTLSQIITKQLQPPPSKKEVEHEDR
jgi:hypothetical protein